MEGFNEGEDEKENKGDKLLHINKSSLLPSTKVEFLDSQINGAVFMTQKTFDGNPLPPFSHPGLMPQGSTSFTVVVES